MITTNKIWYLGPFGRVILNTYQKMLSRYAYANIKFIKIYIKILKKIKKYFEKLTYEF